MNITNLRGKDFEAKEEENNNKTNESKLSKLASSSTGSRQWAAGSRNPRIVRVSRAFGGKDRHSKVCTIRGLRDRRIRLSVPTAIQLYDLQDRLGVGQPSKVVDWLLDVTKDDIDKLPPLQISPQGDFSQFLQPHTRNSAATSSFPTLFDANSPFFKAGININNVQDQDQNQEIGGSSRSKNDWEFGVDGEFSRGKDKDDTGDHMKIDQTQDQIAVQNFFPLGSHSSMPVYLNNMMMPYNNVPSYYQWDPASNLSLSQFGGLQGPFANNNHSQDPHQNSDPNDHRANLPNSSQLLFYPSTATIPSVFPTYSPFFPTQMENNVPRQMNHFQEGPSSSAQQNNFPRSFQLSLSPDNKLISSQDMNESEEEDTNS